MARFGMAIDLERCTACGACLVACAQEENVPPGDPATAKDRLVRWMELVPFERGDGDEPRVDLLPMPCQHCDHPPCATVCPVYATYRSPDGLVPQVYRQCIGCRYCVNACPYTCKHYNWDDPVWTEPMARGWNPDVSIRSRGVTEKCNFCLHRIMAARDRAAEEDRDLAPGDVATACQVACPTEAIAFGDLDSDPDLRDLVRSPRAFRLGEDLGTEPKVFYLGRRS